MKNIEEIKIVIDENVIYEYERHYFKLHPRARKSPIESPIHPSINKWMIMKRPQMNDLKQKWKSFIIWLVEKYGFTNMKLNNVKIIMVLYFKTKARHDSDNYSPKFIFDGLTESGMIIDDDFKHIESLTIKGGYDKENPRTEIIIQYQKGE